jgi:hypothetical protein
MRLRRACTIVALCSVLFTSGCFFHHCCCRRDVRERDCGCPCACESSSYAPPLAPPPAAPAIPPPAPLMPGSNH